ncbi:MAG: ABC transporter permease [Planctomycetes bacterium]|nr:ABC transporter permease [Planctomycetota bacterium]
MFAEEGFHNDILLSLARVFGGFLISAAFGVPLGILMGASRTTDTFFAPIIGFIRYMPATAFIPLAILWFGVGYVENVVLVFMSIFFYLVLLVADAAANVKKPWIDTALTLGANRLQVVTKVVVRAAAPDVWNAMRTMFGVGWTMIVVVELVGAEAGIGAKIIHAQRFLQTPKIMAGICIIGLLGVASDLCFRAGYRFLFPWARN